MAEQTILVAGLGRCGTTLVMRMLDAAGVFTIGAMPDFESVDAQRLLETDPHRWACLVHGKATKLLDAQRWRLPTIYGHDVVFLRRNPRQQARSMLKMCGFPMDRGSIRAMARSIEKDEPRARDAINRMGAPRVSLTLDFEALIERPHLSAKTLASALQLPFDKIDLMANHVRRRSADCLPYLAEAFHG